MAPCAHGDAGAGGFAAAHGAPAGVGVVVGAELVQPCELLVVRRPLPWPRFLPPRPAAARAPATGCNRQIWRLAGRRQWLRWRRWWRLALPLRDGLRARPRAAHPRRRCALCVLAPRQARRPPRWPPRPAAARAPATGCNRQNRRPTIRRHSMSRIDATCGRMRAASEASAAARRRRQRRRR